MTKSVNHRGRAVPMASIRRCSSLARSLHRPETTGRKRPVRDNDRDDSAQAFT